MAAFEITVGLIGNPGAISDHFKTMEVEFAELADGDRQKHVYACFGLAAYLAQCVEVGLKNLLLLHALVSGKALTLAEFDALETRAARKTLGQLLHDIRAVIVFDESATRHVALTLEKRNFLMHSFFEHHAVDFMTDAGMHHMVGELISMMHVFKVADLLLEPVTQVLSEEIGLRPEHLETARQELLRQSAR